MPSSAGCFFWFEIHTQTSNTQRHCGVNAAYFAHRSKVYLRSTRARKNSNYIQQSSAPKKTTTQHSRTTHNSLSLSGTKITFNDRRRRNERSLSLSHCDRSPLEWVSGKFLGCVRQEKCDASKTHRRTVVMKSVLEHAYMPQHQIKQ